MTSSSDVLGYQVIKAFRGGLHMIPGFVKMKVLIKPATAERKGINPFTKEETVFKAKPASKAVKVIAMKALKDSI